MDWPLSLKLLKEFERHLWAAGGDKMSVYMTDRSVYCNVDGTNLTVPCSLIASKNSEGRLDQLCFELVEYSRNKS